MLQVPMVGATFRPASAREAFKQLKIGDRLELRADPDNEYDSTAVACYYAHHHLGFIPKESNSALFTVLIDGAKISAEIIAFKNTLKPVLEIHFDSMPADEDHALEPAPDGSSAPTESAGFAEDIAWRLNEAVEKLTAERLEEAESDKP